MDLIKEALSMGFANAAIMDTKDLVFVPEYRQFCEDNLCGNYNLVPACPPACGTVEEMQEKAMKYEKALVLQTVLKIRSWIRFFSNRRSMHRIFLPNSLPNGCRKMEKKMS